MDEKGIANSNNELTYMLLKAVWAKPGKERDASILFSSSKRIEISWTRNQVRPADTRVPWDTDP